jgi:dephospho-CoA kinase
MEVFILSGGIGSGKSTAGVFLRELGAAVIDSDDLAKQALEPGKPAFAATLEVFGRGILNPQGKVDRAKLARIVFNDPEALLKLNRIIHPQVDIMVEKLLKEYEKQGRKAAFIEMAVLAQAPFILRAEGVWVIKSSRDIILDRLKYRGINKKEALARIANQPPVEDQINNKITVIMNDGDKNELKARIEKLWKEI